MSTRATRTPRRRAFFAVLAIVGVLSAFVIRLVDIQVVSASAYVADSQSSGRLGMERTLSGTRGTIVDAQGQTLASSVQLYDLKLDPSLIVELEEDELRPPETPWAEAAQLIGEIIDLPTADILASVDAVLAENPDSQYLPLAQSLDSHQYLLLRDLGLPYVAFDSRSTRVYPNGAVAGNLVGFMGSDGAALAGIELMYDACLQPTDGVQTYLRGKDGVVIPGSEKVTDPIDGGTVQLTINSDLNWYLQQMIAEEVGIQGAKAGSVFVVEVATGKIRAAASYPSVDPNDVSAVAAEYREDSLFRTTFEPGSTYKALTAAALIEEGAATPLSTVTAEARETMPNGQSFSDAVWHPKYNYTLTGALIDSSNVALAKFGTQISAQTRYDYLSAFGVGERTAVGFLGEESGLLHPVSEWDGRSLYTTTFGQYFTVTVPQVASAYQTLANGGLKVPLQLVESCTYADGTVEEPELPEPVQVVSESTANQVTQMLENVATQSWLASQIAVPGYRLATKSGTAEKPGADGTYKKGLYYTSMVGYAPADDPEYVVMVSIDEPTRVTSSGATAAAFQKAMTQVLKTYRVAPSATPAGEPLPKTK